MKIFKIYLVFYLTILSNWCYSQDTIWSILRKGSYDRNTAKIVTEHNSNYYIFSNSIDTFNLPEYGFAVSKIHEKNGQLLDHVHYEEDSLEFDFNRLNKVLLDHDKFILTQATYDNYVGISLFEILFESQKTIPLIKIPSPIQEELSTLFLNDMICIGEYYYIMTTILTKENNEPLIIKVNKTTLEYTYLRFKDKLENITSCKLLENKDGILGLFLYYGKEIVSGGHHFIQFDLEGNILWEYRSPTDVPNFNINSASTINDDEILMSTMDAQFNFSTFLVENRPSVVRFNTKTKKTVYYTWWDEIYKPFMPEESKIIKGHKDKEYMLMCGDYNITDNYTEGRIVKFDENGKRIWKKNYVYFPQNNVNNIFTDIIATGDGNYLMCGYNGLGRSNWLVKINEDGDILKIDTTTAVSDIIALANIDVKIYPNPTAGLLIINQGNVSGVKYQLYDLQGCLVKAITISESNTNAVWDLTDINNGFYNLVMSKDGKMVGSSKMVVKK